MTHDSNARKHPSVGVMLIDSPADAYDYEVYAARLADTRLVKNSLALRPLPRVLHLLRPHGQRLHSRPGRFPHPRLRWMPSPLCRAGSTAGRPPR